MLHTKAEQINNNVSRPRTHHFFIRRESCSVHFIFGVATPLRADLACFTLLQVTSTLLFFVDRQDAFDFKMVPFGLVTDSGWTLMKLYDKRDY